MKLSDFLERFKSVETTADGVLVHCPAHDDSAASLRVTVSDRGRVLVKCRAGCETAAVMKSLGLTMRDLSTMAPGDFAFAPATSTDAPASPADVARLAVDLDRWAAEAGDGCPAHEYAASRFGVELNDFRRLGLGFATDLPGGPRLVVPFRDRDGVPRGYQARALQKDARVRWLGPKSPEGASWARVGYFEGGSGWDEVLVTEGPGDALTGVGLGYDTVLIRGAGLVSNASVVDTVADMIGDRLAVICGDGDPAGRTFASRLARELMNRGVRVKNLAVPDDEDLTSWRERDPVRFSSDIIRAISQERELVSSQAVLQDRDEERYPLTDLGNARFVRDFTLARGSGVKYSPEAGYYLLKGGVWKPDTLDRARAFVQEAADRVAAIADGLLEASDGIPGSNSTKRAKRWASWARHSQSSNGIGAALKELAALPDVATDVNRFDCHPDLMAVANGVVNLRTGELTPHDPSLLLTRRVEIDYDPEATAPRWERFLDEIFPNHPELPAFMRRWVGYGITGRTDEQAFAVLWGTGANGKSVLTDTLTEVFRDLTVTTPFSTFEQKPSGGIPNDLAALKGARLVMAAEGDQGRPMAEAVLKRVTGKDLIAARFMRKEFFEFRPTFALMLATNFKPNFRGQDAGLWRRVKLIPFERFFAPDERDHRLGDTLMGERAGILAWAVRGAREWYARGLQDPAAITEATREYQETSDVLNGFLPGVYVADPDSRVEARTVFQKFLDYADEGNYLDLKRWSNRALYGALEERGFTRRRGGGNRLMIEGIRLATAADHAAAELDGATSEPVAHSPSNPLSAPVAGASLSDVL